MLPTHAVRPGGSLGEQLPTIAAAVDGWLESLELAGSPRTTIRTYRSLIKPVRSDDTILALNAARCRELLAGRMRSGSLSTASTFRAALAAFATYCRREGWLLIDPLATVPKPKPRQRAHRYLSAAQLRAIWAAAEEHERIPLLLLMQGLRAHEVCAVRYRDCDLAAGVIRLVVTKGSRPRTVPLDPALAAMLSARTWRGADRLYPRATSTLRDLAASLGSRAGVPGVHPHLFRHSFASLGLKAGVGELAMMTLLGHANLTMVREYSRSALQDLAVEQGRGLTARLLEAP